MSLRSIRSGATALTEASLLQFITDLLSISGVLDTTGTQFQVTGSGSNLSVNVAIGRAYLLASNGNGYPISNESSANVLINANASGNPRITSIVLYQDLSATPNSDATNIAKLIAVDGTAAASPSAPDTTAIQTAIGASNPYTVLANVRVNSGVSVINTSDVTDKRTQVRFRSDILNADQWVSVDATTATTTLDLSLGKKFQVNLKTASTTLALLNVPKNCKSILVRTTQDATGGRTFTWFGGIAWQNGGAVPTPTATANKSDEYVINFLTVTNDSTNTSEGVVVGLNG